MADSLDVRAENSAVALKVSHRQPIEKSGAEIAPGATFVKIDSNFEPQAGQGPTGAGAAGAANQIQRSRSSHAGQSSAADKADLSSEAQQFAKLSAQATQVPDVRADRVATLKNAIQNGTYSVSNQQIAQAMSRDFSKTP
jgi:flagellar biosynthesis anti-sigma factor FlgM